MGICDEIDDATITIDKTTVLEIKATICLKLRYFQKSSFNIKSELFFQIPIQRLKNQS